MNEPPFQSVTQALQSMAAGDKTAAAKLLPLVYTELRRLAAFHLSKTPPGRTLQPTALVHEAYLKLFNADEVAWDSRGHFFTAAARAMRNILVDQARRKASLKRGGDRRRVEVDPADIPIESPVEDLLALHEALERLEAEDPRKAQIVMLRHFAGFDRDEVAELLGVSTRTIDREWRYIVAYLHRELNPGEPPHCDP